MIGKTVVLAHFVEIGMRRFLEDRCPPIMVYELYPYRWPSKWYHLVKTRRIGHVLHAYYRRGKK